MVARSGFQFERELVQLRRRLLREGTLAIDMLERAIAALQNQDHEAVMSIRRTDDTIDNEEVEIEQEAYRLLIAERPYASDFRLLAFILRSNGTIERVADHANSIAKVTGLLNKVQAPPLPASLLDLTERIPIMCHDLMRAVLDEDAERAREIVRGDKVMDALDKQVFRDLVDLIQKDPELTEAGMLMYRVSRELERVGDLMGDIAEDVVYLVTGEIVRHEKRRRKTG